MQKIDGTTILLNRGDNLNLVLTLKVDDESIYTFKPNDKIRFAIYNKNSMNESPVLEKEIVIQESGETLSILCTGEETKFGDYINKPVDYWYEIVFNDYYTILGYDTDGPKILRLYPEGYIN